MKDVIDLIKSAIEDVQDAQSDLEESDGITIPPVIDALNYLIEAENNLRDALDVLPKV